MVAKETFIRKGYVNTTMDEIAQQAGVGKGSIYYYFKTKDDLYLSLMIPVLAALNKSLERFRKRLIDKKCQDYEDFVMGFYRHYRDVYKSDADGVRIIQKFQLGDFWVQMSEKHRAEFNRYTKNNFEIARDIISMAMDLKLIPKANPVILSDWFWSTFIGIVQFEESKFRNTKKDYILSTLKEAFLLISRALRPNEEK